MRIIIIYLLIQACHPVYIQAFSKKIPVLNENSSQQVVIPVDNNSQLDVYSARESLFNYALSHKCSKATHDVQGAPRKAYMKGIVSSFAYQVCNPKNEASIIARMPLKTTKEDALAHYGFTGESANERHSALFSLILGSAARESSWRWCKGRDPGANNADSLTAEAGLYQTSFNSSYQMPVLKDLFRLYQVGGGPCFSPEYKQGVTCKESDLKNWGSGDGLAFQRLTKDCPGFATEYHSVMLRMRRTHYGPINTKKAMLKTECKDMFSEIRSIIENDSQYCLAFGN